MEEPHMQMGISDVYLTGVTCQQDGSFSLYGMNFTQNSRVFINGERVPGKFLNNTRIEIEEGELEDGDTIVINQMGSQNRIFRSSAEYLWKDQKLTEQVVEPADEENAAQTAQP